MEMICSSETSVDFQQTTRRCIPEDRTLHNHRCKNLKSYYCILFSTLEIEAVYSSETLAYTYRLYSILTQNITIYSRILVLGTSEEAYATVAGTELSEMRFAVSG
jgi:hypothetical protein